MPQVNFNRTFSKVLINIANIAVIEVILGSKTVK